MPSGVKKDSSAHLTGPGQSNDTAGASKHFAYSRSEKGAPPATTRVAASRGLYSRPVYSIRGSVLAVLASSALLFWLLADCTEALDLGTVENSSRTPGLVRDAVQKPSATPTPSGSLEVFQVYQPVITPGGITDETALADRSGTTTFSAQKAATSSCELLLMEHSFGFSYGIPFVGAYTPPKCKFNRVTMNFTVTSRGRQFDRLALMYFGDTEVWRTSTAEPTTNGIRWEYHKDMTEYLYFWTSPQTLIFDLGNLIDSNYTGFFNTTLTATFFTSEGNVQPASVIIPVSARKGSANAASVFTLPSENATNSISFPRNVNRAVFAVSACGQAAEEFWWSNVLQSDTDTFMPVVGTLYGYSPFREVQVLIDGMLAGVHWPFPVIFTGGVVPGLWRPIVGIDAFDLREHEIDITPWLPLLCDGAEHTFEIRVVGIVDDGKETGMLTETVGSSWLVTGKIFVWLDQDSSSVTTGEPPTRLVPAPVIRLSQSLKQNSTGANETLSYTTDVERSISVSALVTTQNGSFVSTWTQSLAVKNYGLFIGFGATQQNSQTTTGVDTSIGGTYYKSSYSYPLYANSSYTVQPGGNFTIDADLQLGLDLAIDGTSVFPSGLQNSIHMPRVASVVPSISGSFLSTRQNGTAHYFGAPSAGRSSGYGSTSQDFSFKGVSTSGTSAETELYYRSVEAVNATVVRDYESLLESEIKSYGLPLTNAGKPPLVMGVESPKAALGRGPGIPKQLLVQVGG
ncbi:hypothetical protein QTJ16_005491 [Diplocarpon rosae]|uniref:Peptide N-acetyl-beta-D-glucosaminyl asparaginase amidase A N-terminal domain-containing protein n=1 Tax=Diplocarpon rosae TaxID=946125 RepID=A0AAD9SX27_9HELO|nr:hypothetical protein QTJ16_005491 [Diplocarpon rosae]PBP22289.1 hypothetical protein BUE80_DR006841 [Diplocarpon rosae]